jgi:hypothetical protein
MNNEQLTMNAMMQPRLSLICVIRLNPRHPRSKINKKLQS